MIKGINARPDNLSQIGENMQDQYDFQGSSVITDRTSLESYDCFWHHGHEYNQQAQALNIKCSMFRFYFLLFHKACSFTFMYYNVSSSGHYALDVPSPDFEMQLISDRRLNMFMFLHCVLSNTIILQTIPHVWAHQMFNHDEWYHLLHYQHCVWSDY